MSHFDQKPQTRLNQMGYRLKLLRIPRRSPDSSRKHENINEQQEQSTKRHNESPLPSISEDDGVNVIELIKQFEYANQFKKEALAKADLIIKELQLENIDLKHKLQRLEDKIRVLSRGREEFCKNSKLRVRPSLQTSSKTVSCRESQISHFPSSKVTSVKISSHDSNPSTVLAQIQKIDTEQHLLQVLKQKDQIENLIEEENNELLEANEQKKYLESSLQNEIYNYPSTDIGGSASDGFESNAGQHSTNKETNIYILSAAYRDLLIHWQNYANTLRFCLYSCLQFIQKMYSHSQSNPIVNPTRRQHAFINNKSFQKHSKNESNELIDFVMKDILQVITGFQDGLRGENKELRAILDQIVKKISPQLWSK